MVKVPSRSEGLLAEDVQHDSNSETAEKWRFWKKCLGQEDLHSSNPLKNTIWSLRRQSVPISAMPGIGKKSNRAHDEGIVPRSSRGRNCREQLMLDDSHTWCVAPSTQRKTKRLSAHIQLSPVGWLPPHSALLRFATETVLWGAKGEEGLKRLRHVDTVPRDTHPHFRGTQSTSSLPVTSRFLFRYQ